MPGEGFRKKLLQRLSAVENARLKEEKERERRAEGTENVYRDTRQEISAFSFLKRKLRIGLCVFSCVLIAAVLQEATGIAFFFWYVPLCCLCIYALWKRVVVKPSRLRHYD